MNCPNCDAGVGRDARFCASCGHRLDAPELLEPEARLVTVVFADMTQSVERTAHLHPEEARDLVNEMLEAVTEVVARYEGVIDRFLGDGALAVFGAPRLHEDDAERAVRAGLDIVERAAEIGLGATVGVNTGEVYHGAVGSERHVEQTVMGPVVNLAARLQGLAAEGEVLIGESTERHVRRGFELSSRVVSIKGLDAPENVFLAERLLDRPEKMRGIEGLQARLVGRDKALGTLEQRVAAPGGGVMLIEGPAGIGKSRLVSELRRRTGDVRWLECRCLELEVATPYAMFVDLMRLQLGHDPVAALEALVGDETLTADDLDRAGPFVADMLGAAAMPHSWQIRVMATSAERRKALTMEAVVDLVAALTREGRSILMIDDLHWADPLSSEVLRLLIGRQPSGLVLVATSRPDPGGAAAVVHEVADPSRFERVELEELSAAESHQMIDSMLRIDDLPSDVESLIVARAQGNPFYVEEVIRSLIQRGAVRRVGEQWVADAGVDISGVPESIQSVVMGRIDRLDRDIRISVQIASVLGRTFPWSFYTRVTPGNPDDEIAALLDAGLIHEERAGSDPEYGFLHSLAHAAVYEGLLPSRRAAIHEQAGDVLTEEASPELIEQIAFHYERSRNDAKAVPALVAAGERAMSRYANDDALHWFDAALPRIDGLSGQEVSSLGAVVNAHRGEVLVLLARHDDAEAALRRALELLDDEPLEEARIWRFIGQSLRLRGSNEDALGAYDRAEAALDRSAERDSPEYHRAWLDVCGERAWCYYFGGRAGDIPRLNERRQPIADRYGTDAQRSDLVVGRLQVEFRDKRYLLDDESVEIAREAHGLAVESADLGRTAEAGFALGFTLLWADRLAESAEEFDHHLDLIRRIGDRTLLMRHLGYSAVVSRRTHSIAATVAIAGEALDVADSIGHEYYAGHARANLAWAAWAEGDIGRGHTLGVEAMKRWGESDGFLGTEFAWMAVWPLASMSLAEGDVDEARRALQFLAAPHERPMREPLASTVDAVLTSPPAHDLEKLLARACEEATTLQLL